MTNQKTLSNFEILMKGQLTVNLPCLIIIFLSFYGLSIYSNLNPKLSILIGFVLSWIYWSFSVKRWIKWAVIENHIDREKLYKIGKLGLLLWNKNHIDEVVDNNKKPWF